MAEELNTKILVEHIASGTLRELCLLCLTPLQHNSYESIFTAICTADSEYRVVDALSAVCQIHLQDSEEEFNMCIQCYTHATYAYKFHLQAKHSIELINHYTGQIVSSLDSVSGTDDDDAKLLVIPLHKYIPVTRVADINLDGIGLSKFSEDISSIDDHKEEIKIENQEEYDENVLVVVEKESSSESGNSSVDASDDEEMFMIINEKKERKKRDPMLYMKCTRCPVKYRLISKLKEHMKSQHNVELYYCKICSILTEQKLDYEEHLKQHSDKYQCSICNILYKKRETLEAHMKLHEQPQIHTEQIENANICEKCGAICSDESALEEHMRARHLKNYTCYYCGKLYRALLSYELHLAKHERYWANKHGSKSSSMEKAVDKTPTSVDKSKRSVCPTCGKDFVDDRALMWHQRLHTDDRPYKCEECGRGFVSLNRRNQHAMCAHTPPPLRCPLCPALFHLRSMVNTHIKKVHLNPHKRCNRPSKHKEVFWKTQTVPIQELSIDVQNGVLELQAAQTDAVANDETIFGD